MLKKEKFREIRRDNRANTAEYASLIRANLKRSNRSFLWVAGD